MDISTSSDLARITAGEDPLRRVRYGSIIDFSYISAGDLDFFRANFDHMLPDCKCGCDLKCSGCLQLVQNTAESVAYMRIEPKMSWLCASCNDLIEMAAKNPKILRRVADLIDGQPEGRE